MTRQLIEQFFLMPQFGKVSFSQSDAAMEERFNMSHRVGEIARIPFHEHVNYHQVLEHDTKLSP